MRVLGYALLCALFGAGCGWQNKTRGSAALEGRLFVGKPAQLDQEVGNHVSMVAEPETFLQSKNENHLLTLRPFLRLDQDDPNRSHWDVRRADYIANLGNWELAGGIGQFNWGVLESHRLVDVINQDDYVENLNRSAKLGQPYLQVGYLVGDWAFRLYALPIHRAATFPGPAGRLRFAVPVDPDQAVYQTALGEWQTSVAARASGVIDDFDLGISLFSGVSREARFIAQLTTAEIVPVYEIIHQAAVDAQWTYDAWAIKVEGLARLWAAELNLLVAGGAGVEYSIYDLWGADLTLVAEYLYDSRPATAAVTFFQNDGFLGFRLGLNDPADTQVLAGAITDVEDQRTYLRVEGQRRIGERWRLVLRAYGYFGEGGALESGLLADDYGEVRLAYFF